MYKNFLSELLGSFLFILIIIVSGAIAKDLAPFAIAGALMFCIYTFGQISGGHFNPAVSIAAYVRGKLALGDLPYYILAQLTGGLLAALLGFYLSNITGLGITLFNVKPSIPTNVIPAMIVELIMTFALCLTVLMVATSPKTENNSFYGFAIGLTVLVGALTFGKISGGAFNPAVAISTTVGNMQHLASDSWLVLSYVYVLPQILAGVLAGVTYKVLVEDIKFKLA